MDLKIIFHLHKTTARRDLILTYKFPRIQILPHKISHLTDYQNPLSYFSFALLTIEKLLSKQKRAHRMMKISIKYHSSLCENLSCHHVCSTCLTFQMFYRMLKVKFPFLKIPFTKIFFATFLFNKQLLPLSHVYFISIHIFFRYYTYCIHSAVRDY